MDDKIKTSLTVLVPALVAYLVGAKIIPAGLEAEATALILAVGAVGWAVYEKRRAARIKAVAAMPGTTVSPDGRTITVVDPSLATVAKEAATNAAGK